jgi:hypothetical protein
MAKSKRGNPTKHKRVYVPVDFKKIKLEMGVPYPTRKHQSDEFLKLYTDMKVGQSFQAHKKFRAKCRSAALDFESENPKIEFVHKAIPDTDDFRIWKMKRED